MIGRDEYNSPIMGWGDFATVWASVEPISGQEYWASSQVQAEVTHRIRVRYLSGVRPTIECSLRSARLKLNLSSTGRNEISTFS